MSNVSITGVNLSNGQYTPLAPGDIATRSDGTPIGAPTTGALTITSNGQTVFTLPTAPFSAALTYIIINTATYTSPTHFTLSGATVTWLNPFPLSTTDLFEYEYF